LERRALRDANDSLTKLRRDEESKWAQRVKVKHIQEVVTIQNIFILLLMANIGGKNLST
jgi:hypothetical protein